jgi:hypothetical protein
MEMLAQIEPAPNFYPIITTDGITIAIVSFLFACFVFPKTVKHRPQFYAAFFITIAIILLATLRLMLYQSGLYVVFGVLTGIAQVAAIVMLFLASGGMSIGEFTEEVKESYEVIRRGETEKEVIVPLRGEQPRARRDVADAPANVHVIETPRTKPDRSGPMPLE